MRPEFIQAKNSTVVRFFALAMTIPVLMGCTSLTSLRSQLEPCPTAGRLICEAFGPETRCTCAGSALVSRELERFSQQAPLGLRGW